MELEDPMFGLMKQRMNWHAQRQEVLAHNVANADTPRFRPRDLMPMKFTQMLQRQAMQVNMDVTTPGHLPGTRKRVRDFTEQEEAKPFETAPAGNGVIMEEQMAKLNENQMAQKMTTELYKKHMNNIRVAIGKR
ncbi:MAG: flagellar basal body rod protein FlgB [Magnetospirillum sp. WYHS-4]